MGRRDGKKVKIDAMHKLQIRLNTRCQGECYIDEKIDVTNLVKYLEKYNKKNIENKITCFHAFSTAIAKVVYNRPLLNRFIINKDYYDRNNISIAFTAKIKFEDKSDEVLSVINIDDKDDVLKVREKILARVNKIRKTNDDLGGTDNAMNLLAKLPKPILTFLVWVIKKLDNHDLLPQSLTKDSLFHSTILISNVGSIGGDALYHHLTEFGTNSIVMTIGKIREEETIIDGKKQIRSFCNFGITLDERIADGFYFIKSFKYFEQIINNPETLFDTIDTKVELENE